MDVPVSDIDATVALLNDAKLRLYLLTKQANTRRKVIAELYEERDAAWAALLEFAGLAQQPISGSGRVDYSAISLAFDRHTEALAAARAGVKSDGK